MRRLAQATLVAALLTGSASAQPSSSPSAQPSSSPSSQPSSAVPPEVVRLLDQIKAADKDLLAVSEEDGRFLRLMAVSSRATRALEIGAASGYSAIWIGLGLRQTRGQLTTIEYDPARARAAAENIRRAGLAETVTVVSGDAFKEIPKLTGSFD
jgi:predicted O-methyltransferase YrrM